MKDLKGKTALVTGAARGIGKAVAKLLAQHGANSIVADVDISEAKKVVDEFHKGGLDAAAVKLDVADPDAITEATDWIWEKFGGIDIMVNNAGINANVPIPEMTIEQWDRVVDIDLRGTHLCSQAALKHMMKKGGGRIVNMGSMAGQIGGLKVSPDYSAAKAGVICLAKCYARFGAQYNITANAVAPGFIETEMTKGRDDPGSVPVGRLGTPEDIANTVYFLVSDLGAYITGTTIDVNGGLQMR